MAKEGEKAPAKTIFGRIVVGVAVAAISGLLGTLGGYIIARDKPPAAEISPPGLTASADEVIQFTAAASRDPENRSLTYAWSVGGTTLDESPVARCSAQGSLAECRFLVRGTFGVVVTATDEGGLSDSAAAHVTVEVEGGYIGLRVMDDVDKPDAVYRALLAAVDWVEVQRETDRILIFYDPVRERPIYAAAIRPDPDVDLGALSGINVALPLEKGPAYDIAKAGLEAAGAAVFWSGPEANGAPLDGESEGVAWLSPNEDRIDPQSERADAGAGFVPISTPDEVLGPDD